MDYGLIIIAFLAVFAASIYALIAQKRAAVFAIAEMEKAGNRLVEVNNGLIRMNEAMLDRMFIKQNLPPAKVDLAEEHAKEQQRAEERREQVKESKLLSLSEARKAAAAREGK